MLTKCKPNPRKPTKILAEAVFPSDKIEPHSATLRPNSHTDRQTFHPQTVIPTAHRTLLRCVSESIFKISAHTAKTPDATRSYDRGGLLNIPSVSAKPERPRKTQQSCERAVVGTRPPRLAAGPFLASLSGCCSPFSSPIRLCARERIHTCLYILSPACAL